MLRVRQPLLAVVGAGPSTATATGSSTVTAVGSSSVVAKPIQGLTFLFGALYDAGGGGAADASATGSSSVSAQFSALATFSADASGSSVVSAAGSEASTAATTASATGSSAVSATTVPTAAKAPSVEQKFARWASYQRIGSSYIRQVSPGVYLRVRPEETVPQIVAQERDIGRLDEVSLRGNAIALGLTKEDQRKLRKELRKIKAEEARVVRICGTTASCAGFSQASARGSKAYTATAKGGAAVGGKMSARASATAEATNGGIEHSLTIRYNGFTRSELIDILEQLEII